jgi:hypothetical protein
MDLNQLLYRQQVSLMRADAAASPEARHSHRGLARGYAERIRALQADYTFAKAMTA